jgi:signal transduction histidine kinase
VTGASDYTAGYRIVQRSGPVRVMAATTHIRRNAAGQPLQLLGAIQDVTAQKEVEAALARARDQALAASRLKSELLAKVSHELRTPLSAIMGYTELLQNGVFGPVTAEQHQTFDKIITSTQYLADLVGELLTQAQLESGRLRLAVQPFELTKLAEAVQARLGALAQHKDLALTIQIDEAVPSRLCGDARRVQQILINLVSNAIKFTDAGRVQVRLYRPDADHWAMEVADTGPGIPAEAQAQIFEPFGQVDGSRTRQHRGAGLGLAIVDQLTTLMGGQIKLDSQVGHGTVFTIFLPLILPKECDHPNGMAPGCKPVT